MYMLYFVNKCEANCKAISAVAYGDFLAKSLHNGRKRQIWGRGGGGGVKWYLIYLYIHQNESEAESQGEAFRALFRD